MSEYVPICRYCPLRREDIDDALAQRLRDRATHLFYNEYIEISEIPEVLMEQEDVSDQTAHAATGCLNKMYRFGCLTGVIDYSQEQIQVNERP